MSPTDVAKLVAPVGALYSASLEAHGVSSLAVGWKDRDSQWLRFDKLATVIDAPAGMAFSVNDVGCGYAAMFEYLAARHGSALTRYCGYDISPEMLQAARAHAPDPRVELVQAMTAQYDADYSFVSGSFNVKLDASEEEWTDYIETALVAIAARSIRGLAFNLLTTFVDWREPELYYGDPYRFVDFCRRHISRRVALLHDYPLFEWTIIVRK
jgi:SAM-dependent methyltransferase